ncbi:MAG: hypothetical protein QOD41_4353 [Cryptosporangiaceae bacterium]|nr:hypothetical protein [Cryptosporangiaceae bacterium]
MSSAHAHGQPARRPRRRRLSGLSGLAVAGAIGVTAALATVPLLHPLPTFGKAPPDTALIPLPAPSAPCAAGPAQREVETYIAAHPGYGHVTADGVQSPEDCTAIRTLQERFDVRNPSGSADALTGALISRLNSAPVGSCDTNGPAVNICVDLTTQTMWAVRDSEVVLGPTIIRSGKAGEETPTGDFTIHEKKRHTVSTITGTPMEYWQHMQDGYGFHQAWSYLHDPNVSGSLGCVNMTRKDSADLFSLTNPGTSVHIFGRKPGT